MRLKRLADRFQIKQTTLLWAGLFTFALLLRLWQLDARSLWFDEGVEYWSAVGAIGSIPQMVIVTYQPPLFSLILHFWLQLGQTGVWLRLLSVIFSMLSLLGVVLLARKLPGKTPAWIAGLLFAILPNEIRYAQEVAEYALMECCLIWSLYCLYQSLEKPAWRHLLGWGLFSLLAVYSHYGTAIVITVTTAAAFFEALVRRNWAFLQKQALVAALALLAGIPLIKDYFLIQVKNQPKFVFQSAGLADELNNTLLNLGKTFLFSLTGWPYTNVPIKPVLVLTLGLLALSLLLLYATKETAARRLLIWFWAALLFYALLVRGGWYGNGGYGFRYANILTPLFVWLLAFMQPDIIQHARRILGEASPWFRGLRFAAWALLLAIGLLALYSLPNKSLTLLTRGNMNWPESDEINQMTQDWAKNKQPDEFTYVYYKAVPSFRYYARLYGYEQPDPLPDPWLFECWSSAKLPYCQQDGVYYGPWIRGYSQAEIIASIETTFGSLPERLWVVSTGMPAEELKRLEEALEMKYTVVQQDHRLNAFRILLALRK